MAELQEIPLTDLLTWPLGVLRGKLGNALPSPDSDPVPVAAFQSSL
jgi:FXSXX-COOH protein